MKLNSITSADEFIEYLRNLNNWSESDFVYDFNLIVHFLAALLDNLREHSLDAELEDIGYSFTDDQRNFLDRIAKYALKVSDEDR